MPALISLATEADRGLWLDAIAHSPCLTVSEYPGAPFSCCDPAPETAPADELEASAGDVVPAGTGFADRGRVAPHCGAVSQ